MTTTASDPENRDKKLLDTLGDTWAEIDGTFRVEPAPLPDWTALVRESRRAAKRKLWRELTILWCAAVPMLGVMLLLLTGLAPVFWILQAAAAFVAVPMLAKEIRRAAGSGKGGAAP